MKKLRKYLTLSTIAVLIIGIDQWTKMAVVSRFRLGESISVIEGIFNLTFIRNFGAAFGILATADSNFRTPFFIIVPVVALLAIGYVFQKVPENDLRMTTALSLVIAGAVGNLIDRLTIGYVVDFLDFHWRGGYHFPAFNVADSAITVGVGLLMLDLFIQDQRERKSRKPHKAHKKA